MGYSIVEFAKSLRGDRCKIRNTPNLIFLCGGKIGENGPYLSCRDYFWRHLKNNAKKIADRVRLAEDVNKWFRGGEFPDLLMLENYVAHLADITVLFVESPGSIAELGAFAASDTLRPKTLAVVNTFYEMRRTFIIDGPIQKILNEDKSLVHYYEWNPENLNSTDAVNEFREIAEGLTRFLKSRAKSLPKQQAFNINLHGHVLLMITDLIETAGVATSTDIARCLEALGGQANRKDLNRYLSLLESMSFIANAHRSNEDFFVPGSSRRFIRYAYQPGVVLKERTKIVCSIRNNLSPLRRSVLAYAMHKSRREGPRNV